MNNPEQMPTDRPRNQGAFIALLILLAWITIPLGSNRPWAWSMMQAGTLLILSVWLINWLRRPYALPAAVTAARVPLILLGLWLVYLLLQTAIMPGEVIKFLSPSTYELYAYALNSGSAPLTVDRGATLTEFLKAVSYVALFFLVLVLVDSRNRLKLLVKTLLFVGFAQALYGLLVYFAPYDFALWGIKGHSVSGTYVNRNHFAGLMEMTIPLGLGLIMYRMAPRQYYPNWKARLRGFAQFLLSSQSKIYLFVLIMFAALFLSTSRGGIIALFAALMIMLSLVAIVKGRKAREIKFTPWLLVLAVGAGLWLGIGGLQEKLERSGLEIDRIPVWQDTLPMVTDHAVFGSGAGSYRWLLPLYRSDTLGNNYYEHVHNDYLEVLLEQGLIGFLLLGSVVILVFVKNIRAYLNRRDHLMCSVLFASLMGAGGLMIHGVVDFNFQIPANVSYFFVLVGVGVVAVNHGQGKH